MNYIKIETYRERFELGHEIDKELHKDNSMRIVQIALS